MMSSSADKNTSAASGKRKKQPRRRAATATRQEQQQQQQPPSPSSSPFRVQSPGPGPPSAARYRMAGGGGTVSSPSPSPSPMLSRRKSYQHQHQSDQQRRQSQRSPSSSSSSITKSPNRKSSANKVKPSKLPVVSPVQRGATVLRQQQQQSKPPLAPSAHTRSQVKTSDDDPPPLPPPPNTTTWEETSSTARTVASSTKRKRTPLSSSTGYDTRDDHLEVLRSSATSPTSQIGKRRKREGDHSQNHQNGDGFEDGQVGDLPKVILIGRDGESFIVAEVDRERRGKHKVNIQALSCTCDSGSLGCEHRDFVMSLVLGVWENDPALNRGALSREQVEQLVSDFERRTAGDASSKEQTFNDPGGEEAIYDGGGGGKGEGKRPDLCVICFRARSQRTVECEGGGCLTKVHLGCLRLWASESLGGRMDEVAAVYCPRCRGEAIMVACGGGGGGGGGGRVLAATAVSPRMQSKKRRCDAINTSNIGAEDANAILPEGTHEDMMTMRMDKSSSNTVTFNDGHAQCILWSELESGGDPAEILLSQKETTSQQDWPIVSTWMPLLGRDLATCLLSKDWQAREAGLRRLARESANALRLASEAPKDSPECFPDRLWRCAGDILARAIGDKVLKVYISAVRCFRTLLVFTNARDLCAEHLQLVRNAARPIVQGLLVRCADGNRRLAELSCRAVLELCRGAEGAIALGGAYLDRQEPSENGGNLVGLDFVLQVLLEERDSRLHQWSSQWQATMGRLTVADRILKVMEADFKVRRQHGAEIVRFTPEYRRMMAVAEFSAQHLGSAHANAARAARSVFAATATIALSHPEAFSVIWELLSSLEDRTLASRMKRKIRAGIARQCATSGTFSSATPEQYMMVDKLCSQDQFQEDRVASQSSSACSSPIAARLLSCKSQRKFSSQWRLNHQQLNRSISHSPSRRCLSSDRSTSQSPARGSMTKSQSGMTRFAPPSPPQRPNFLPLRATASPTSPRDELRLRRQRFHQHQRLSHEDEDAVQPMDHDTMQHYPRLHMYSPPPPPESPLPFVPALFAACCRQFELGVYDDHKALQSPTGGGGGAMSPHSSSPTTKTATNSPTPDRSMSTATRMLSQSQFNQMDETITIDSGHATWDDNYDSLDCSGYEEGRHWGKGMLLGAGAYSNCYQARDIETGTLMAVKQITLTRINNNSSNNNQSGEAFADYAKEDGSKGKAQDQLIGQEVRLLAALSHPNVVRFFGAIKEETNLNIFVEWMAGGSVASQLDRHGPFCNAVIARYLYQQLAGLEYLHSNCILHRDLKGANLLLDSTGQHLRIADFGAAARMAAQESINGEFKGQLQGTIAFMAPEVLRGESYGRSCDIWSLGCCVIEMATARPPWNGPDVSNHLALIFKIACSSRPPPIPSTLCPALSDLASLCLRRRPAHRPTARHLKYHAAFADILMDWGSMDNSNNKNSEE